MPIFFTFFRRSSAAYATSNLSIHVFTIPFADNCDWFKPTVLIHVKTIHNKNMAYCDMGIYRDGELCVKLKLSPGMEKYL